MSEPVSDISYHRTMADERTFRRLALSFDGAEEGSHMGAVDFRVGGRIFATLASIAHGYGNLMLDPDQQAAFSAEMPTVFLPVAGGWGRMGVTHVRLAAASEDVIRGALQSAWKRRVEKNGRGRTTDRSPVAPGRKAPGVRRAKPRI